MTVFALVHGAWHGAWCWRLLTPELERRGHRAVTVDLPCEDPDAGAAEYADHVVAALAGLDEPVIVVGHSLGGLTIPLVARRRPVTRLVFLCAIVPRPGVPFAEVMRTEGPRPAGWPTARYDDTMSPFWDDPDDARAALYHDCPPEVGAWASARLRVQRVKPFAEPSPLSVWPDVPVSSIVCRDDRILSADWSRRIADEQLGCAVAELSGGHSPFLSQPAAVADLLSRTTNLRS